MLLVCTRRSAGSTLYFLPQPSAPLLTSRVLQNVLYDLSNLHDIEREAVDISYIEPVFEVVLRQGLSADISASFVDVSKRSRREKVGQ